MEYYSAAKRDLILDYSFTIDEIKPYISAFQFLNQNISLDTIKDIELIGDSYCGDYKLKCIVDRVDLLPGGKHRLVDYKTGKKKYVKDIQLEIYGYVAEKIGYEPEELQFQFLGDWDERTWHYTAASRSEAEDWILSTVSDIENRTIFHRSKTGLCDYCAVRQWCY